MPEFFDAAVREPPRVATLFEQLLAVLLAGEEPVEIALGDFSFQRLVDL
jgi:hypothetical protein